MEARLTAAKKGKDPDTKGEVLVWDLSDKKLVKMSHEQITGKWCAGLLAAERPSFRSERHEQPYCYVGERKKKKERERETERERERIRSVLLSRVRVYVRACVCVWVGGV